MGIFKDLGFGNNSGRLVSPDSKKIFGMTLTEFKNSFNPPIMKSDVDSLIHINSTSLPTTISQQANENDWVKYQAIAHNFVDTIGVDTRIKLLMNGNDLLDKTGKVITNYGVTVNNTTRTAFGSGSISFNASSYMTTPATSDFNFGSGDFTIETWIKLNSIPNSTTWPGIITHRADHGTRHAWSMWQNPSGIYFEFSSDGTAPGIVTTGLMTPLVDIVNWHHIAVVRYNNVVTIYLDGVAKSSKAYSGSIYYNATEKINIGLLDSLSPGFNRFHGLLDDLRVTKGFAQYTGNFTVPTMEASLNTVLVNKSLTIGGKKQTILSDNNGDPYANNTKLLLSCNDFLDKRNNAVVNSSATLDTTIKKFGSSSLSFGGDAYLTIPSNTDFDFDTGDFTIEFWIRTLDETNATYLRVLTRGGYQTGVSDWIISCRPLEKAIFFQYGNPNVSIGVVNVITSLTWHHVAICRNSGNISIYVDGAKQVTQSAPISLTNNRDIKVGMNYNGGENFIGHLDDIRITKGVSRYNGNFIVPQTEFNLLTPTTTFEPIIGSARSLDVSYTGTLDSVDIETYILE